MTGATDENDGSDGPAVRAVLFDADGGLRLDRVWKAIRGHNASAPDKLPWFALGLVAAVVGGVLWGYLDASTGTLGALSVALVVYLGVVFVETLFSIKSFQWDDEEMAIRTLRSQYADGEYDLEEFERRVDRVHREGPATVLADDSAADGDRDPAAILEQRFARGEIDEDEFRQRMAVLGEPVEGASGEKSGRERALERE